MIKKAALCRIIQHTLRPLAPSRSSARTIVGLAMVALNVPVGWGMGALCMAMAIRSDNPTAWSCAAGVIYVASWAMLLLGMLLAGRSTVMAFRQRLPRACRAWCRQRKMVDNHLRQNI